MLVFMVAILVLSTGCSKKGSSGGSETVTIVVGGWPNADIAFKAALPGFNAEYPNINVEIEMADNNAYHQALTTALAAGNGAPDVAMINGAYISNYRDYPTFVNLLDSPYNAEQYRKDFAAFKWDQVYSLDKKKFIALPWDLGPVTFFYRVDIFKECGLPTEPEDVARYMSTWNGVLDVARKVHIPGQRWLLNEATGFYTLLFGNSDFYNEDLSLRLDREGDIECLNAVIEMRKNKLDMNVSMWAPEGVAGIDNGAVVSVTIGGWFGGLLKNDFNPSGTGNWRITTLPGNIGSSNSGGSYMGIPAQSKHPAEAWAFIKYMLATKKGQNDMFMAVDYFPCYKPAWDDPFYNEPDPYFGGQKVRALWKKIAGELNQGFFNTIMDVTVEGILSDSVTASIEKGLDANGIKAQLRRDIEMGTAELRRQQIQNLRDAGLWKD